MKRDKPRLLKALSLTKPSFFFYLQSRSTKCEPFCNISYPLYIHIQHTSVSGLLAPRLVACRVWSDYWSPNRVFQFDLWFITLLRSNITMEDPPLILLFWMCVAYLTPSPQKKQKKSQIANVAICQILRQQIPHLSTRITSPPPPRTSCLHWRLLLCHRLGMEHPNHQPQNGGNASIN